MASGSLLRTAGPSSAARPSLRRSIRGRDFLRATVGAVGATGPGLAGFVASALMGTSGSWTGGRGPKGIRDSGLATFPRPCRCLMLPSPSRATDRLSASVKRITHSSDDGEV
ncbi:hypothetical protein HEK131_46020 [Streptomyces seoulensis]|nr:hypothetical protein HEK131_46020 [Streptomyces seoulensis]